MEEDETDFVILYQDFISFILHPNRKKTIMDDPAAILPHVRATAVVELTKADIFEKEEKMSKEGDELNDADGKGGKHSMSQSDELRTRVFKQRYTDTMSFSNIINTIPRVSRHARRRRRQW